MVWFNKDVQKREFDSSGQYQAVNFAFVNPSSSGSSLVVPIQTSARIIVLNICVISSDVNSVKFTSNAADITCQWALSPNGGFVLPYSRHGWFQTNIGEALNVTLNAAVQTAIQLAWIKSVS